MPVSVKVLDSFYVFGTEGHYCLAEVNGIGSPVYWMLGWGISEGTYDTWGDFEMDQNYTRYNYSSKDEAVREYDEAHTEECTRR